MTIPAEDVIMQPAPKRLSRKMIITICILAVILAAATVDLYIGSFGKGLIYQNAQEVPAKRAALVLGTVKRIDSQRDNFFYHSRLDTAAGLFRQKKVKAILVSGDNCRHGYNEPADMLEGLLQRGIPREYITLDYAGFRTLDSIVRAKEIFGLDDYIIVSQRFHDERALYIALKNGHKAVAVAAKDAAGVFHLRVRIRETAARLRAFADVQILGTKPRFLGKKETVTYMD